MKLTSMIGAASLSALAAAMAVAAIPTAAFARGDHGGGWQNHGESRSDTGASRPAARTDAHAQRAEGRPAPQGNGWSRQSEAAHTAPQAFAPPQSRFTARDVHPSRDPGEVSGNRTVEYARGTPNANRTYGDPNRNRTYADGNRDRSYGATEVARTTERYNGSHDNHNGHYDGNRHDDGNHHDGGNYHNGDHHTAWNNNWRNDRRYDWHGYRNSHRNVYHLGRYYAPYRSWSYRPLSIGFYLDSLFYSDRYWIDDPYQYRLPEAYGPYRWVRYYDDALLVDIYTGEVVDVIHDFFW